MHAGPKTAFIVVFFVVLVLEQVPAACQQRSFSPTDEPVSVVITRNQVSAGSSVIKRCEAPTPIRVRFQKLKGKNAAFTRTLLSPVVIRTYASEKKAVSTTSIVECFRVADKEGFVGFSFNYGMCEMFNMEYETCGCQAGALSVFYVQDSFWDPKDSKLPQMVIDGFRAIAVVRLPSTVYDKQHLFAGRTLSLPPKNATSLEEQSKLSCTQFSDGDFNCICKGTECIETPLVDIQNCVPETCDAPGNTTIVQLITNGEVVVSKKHPILYMLSECGKTIALQPPPNDWMSASLRVLSHQGYGCQWYPKTGTDHECVVTITGGNRSSISLFYGFGMVLDGNTTTCDGDSLSVYEGAPTDSSQLKNWTACTGSEMLTSPSGTATNLTMVFKRTATQYQADGFNWGFNLKIQMTLGL